ncbi:MAG: hypothetical protein JNK46_10625 [Methylobacteriaceae bacterium]|nr:hypothetical protein [Methylobacteriaceae bacterium]
MTRTNGTGAAGFGRVDMADLARRQLRMSLGLVGLLAAATIFASFAGLRPATDVTASSPPAVKQVLKAASRG